MVNNAVVENVKESKKGNVRRRRKNKLNAYKILDEILLYKIADEGLLCHLHGVHKCKDDPKNHIYYFDKHIDIKEVIDRYVAENTEGNVVN